MALNLVGVLGDETEIYQVYIPDAVYPYATAKPVRVMDDVEDDPYDVPNVEFHYLGCLRWGSGWLFILEGRQDEWLGDYMAKLPADIRKFDGVEVRE